MNQTDLKSINCLSANFGTREYSNEVIIVLTDGTKVFKVSYDAIRSDIFQLRKYFENTQKNMRNNIKYFFNDYKQDDVLGTGNNGIADIDFRFQEGFGLILTYSPNSLNYTYYHLNHKDALDMINKIIITADAKHQLLLHPKAA